MTLSARTQLNRRTLDLRLARPARAPVTSPGQGDGVRPGRVIWTNAGGHGLTLGQVVARAGGWVPASFESHAAAVLGIVSAVLSTDTVEIITAGELPPGLVLQAETSIASGFGWLGPVAGQLRGSSYRVRVVDPPPTITVGGPYPTDRSDMIDARLVVSLYAADGAAQAQVCANEYGQRHQAHIFDLGGFRTAPGDWTSTDPSEDLVMVSIKDTAVWGTPEVPGYYCIWRPRTAIQGDSLTVTGPAVVAKAAAGEGKATGLAAPTDDRVLVRLAGTLQFAQVTTGCIADGAITGAKIGNNQVGGNHIAPSAVGQSQLAAGTVLSSHLTYHCVTAAAIADRAVGGMQLVAASPYSIWGNTTDTAGTVQEIPASADGQVLMRWSGVLGWGSALTLGTNADGGGTLRVYTAAGKYVDIAADGTVTVYQSSTVKTTISATGTITNTRGGTAYSVCDVATITSSTTAPSGSGVKGQMHLIY